MWFDFFNESIDFSIGHIVFSKALTKNVIREKRRLGGLK